jgi:ribosomal-protein-alanine N-acetyltransferase
VTGVDGLAGLRTRRLILRRWRPSDRDPFAALNADPAVMEHFPSVLSRAQSNDLIDRIEAHFDRHGFGLWAVQVDNGPPFVGFVGLSVVPFESHFTPAVEIGWRLAREHWGQGYASQAAAKVLRAAFDQLALVEVVSFTVPANTRSRAVMERVGLTHDERGDFDHPAIPVGHPLRRHVLYRRTAEP